MRITIIGLGVLGASAARALTLTGADVTIFERDVPAGATTGTSFAWTNSHSKDPRGYHDLNVAAMAERTTLAADPNRGPKWYTCNELSSAIDARVPMLRIGSAGENTGFLGYTNPLPTRVDHVFTTPWLNVRPDGGGRLVIQGLDLDHQADPAQPPAPDGELGASLLRRLRHIVTGTLGAQLASLRVGQRAVPADGLSVAGFLGARERVYTLATHSGITLGPLLGRLAAREITSGAPDERLEFRPGRFANIDLDTLRTPPPPRRPGQQ